MIILILGSHRYNGPLPTPTDTKLSGVADMLEGRDAIQRDLDRLKRWACVNRMKFNQTECKVLHMGQGNRKHKYRLGGECLKNIPEEKDWRYWWTRSSTWASNVRFQARKPTVFWAASKEEWTVGRGRGFCPFTPLSWDPTWSTVSSSGASNIRRTWMCWSGSRGGPRRWSEGWVPVLGGQAEGVGAVQSGEEKAAGWPYSSLPVPEGDLQEGRRGTFHKGV